MTNTNPLIEGIATKLLERQKRFDYVVDMERLYQRVANIENLSAAKKSPTTH